jgi:alpha-D-xyloside xylohydrolase
MIAELKSLNIELMVSIWPTVDRTSENYDEMLEKGLLIRQDRGWRIVMEGVGNCVHFDATNPAAREYVWQKAKKNYYDRGIQIFWLDEAEPEYTHYDFDNYRYHAGPDLSKYRHAQIESSFTFQLRNPNRHDASVCGRNP